MAERRMFAKSVIDSDEFLELPARCQLLYFHLGMRADDDGFVNKARAILRLTGCTEADMKTLIAAQYLISFPSGVVVIRHWKINNYLRNDRYRPTVYTEEKAALSETEYGAYVLGIPPVHQRDTQDRIGKDRLDKVSSGKDRSEQQSAGDCSLPEAGAMARPPTATEVMIYVKQKKYHIDPERFVSFYNKNGWMEQGKPMTDWKKAVDLWQQRKW